MDREHKRNEQAHASETALDNFTDYDVEIYAKDMEELTTNTLDIITGDNNELILRF